MKKALLLIPVMILAAIPVLSRDGEEPRYSSSVQLYAEAQEKYQSGQYRESLQLLREALEKNPSYTRAHLLSGQASIEISDFERARVHFEQVLKSDPNSLEARIGKGRALTGLNRLPEAEAIFQEVREKDPGNAENLYGLARLRILAGRLDLARQYLQLILRKNPAFREALQDMAILETRAGRIESGKAYLEKATAVDPAHKSLSITRGIVLSLQADAANNEQTRLALKDEAADAFRTAIRDNPGIELLRRIIQLDIERGYPEEGLEYLEQAREMENSTELKRIAANLSQALYQKTGNHEYLERTIDDLQSLCQSDPEDVLACFRLEMLGMEHTGTTRLRNFLTGRHMQIARKYEKELRYGLMVSHLRSALQLSPGNAEVEKLLLDVHRANGDFQSYLNTLVALRDQNPEEPLWQYRLERALQSRDNYLSYREDLLNYQIQESTHRPSVVLVLDFETRDPDHWNGEQVISRSLSDAINEHGKLLAADFQIRGQLRDFYESRRAMDELEIQDRIKSDYRPLLFNAAYFAFLDELDRKSDSRNRIRYILSGSYTARPGHIEIAYTLSDRFTGNEIYKGKAIASGEDALYRASYQISQEVLRRTPVRGEIVKIEDDRIYIHAGTSDGVKKDQVFSLDSNPDRAFRVVEVDTSFSALQAEKSGSLLSPGMVLLSNPRRP